MRISILVKSGEGSGAKEGTEKKGIVEEVKLHKSSCSPPLWTLWLSTNGGLRLSVSGRLSGARYSSSFTCLYSVLHDLA